MEADVLRSQSTPLEPGRIERYAFAVPLPSRAHPCGSPTRRRRDRARRTAPGGPATSSGCSRGHLSVAA